MNNQQNTHKIIITTQKKTTNTQIYKTTHRENTEQNKTEQTVTYKNKNITRTTQTNLQTKQQNNT